MENTQNEPETNPKRTFGPETNLQCLFLVLGYYPRPTPALFMPYTGTTTILPWLTVASAPDVCVTRVKIRDASRVLQRSSSALWRDCEFLGIDTRSSHGGCLTQKDFWILYVFLCWKRWKTACYPDWRGDRADYLIDCPDDASKLGYVERLGGSRRDADSRFQAMVDADHLLLKSSEEKQ